MKEAEASLTKAVEAKPDFAEAHYLLGMAAFNQNKKDVAKEHLEKYLELAPTGKEAATVKEILPLSEVEASRRSRQTGGGEPARTRSGPTG